MNDCDIIGLYFDRDERAISETAEKYGKYCRSVSYNILQNLQDAEECVNDAYLSAWNSIPPHKPERLSTYMGKLVRNLSISRYRQYSSEKRAATQTALALSELEDCIPDPCGIDLVAEGVVITDAINRYLSSCEGKKRRIFIRRYWALEPLQQIAREFSMSESKVASLMYRMRKELKAYLEKEGIYL